MKKEFDEEWNENKSYNNSPKKSNNLNDIENDNDTHEKGISEKLNSLKLILAKASEKTQGLMFEELDFAELNFDKVLSPKQEQQINVSNMLQSDFDGQSQLQINVGNMLQSDFDGQSQLQINVGGQSQLPEEETKTETAKQSIVQQNNARSRSSSQEK